MPASGFRRRGNNDPDLSRQLPAPFAGRATVRTRQQSFLPRNARVQISGPSEDAANAIAPIVASLREKVREVITVNSPGGITADDIAHILNRSILSVRPRVSELHRDGDIRSSGARGRNVSGMTATLWVIADAPAATGAVQGGEQ
jgi:hypothetical protein